MSSRANISKICRTCMHNSNKLKSIWSAFEDTIIASAVTDCTGVEIVEDSDLPNQICQKCVKELSNYVTFSKKTRDSDKRLRQMFKVKLEDEKDNHAKVEDLLGIEMISAVKEGSEKGDQSDYDDELQDPDYTLPPKPGENNFDRKLEPDANCDDKMQDQDVAAETSLPPKPAAKKVGRKPKPKPPQEPNVPDEIELKTFDTIQLSKDQPVCCSCFQDFPDFKALEQHVKLDHKKNVSTGSSKKMICETCFSGFNCHKAFKRHRNRILHMKSVFECKICKFRCVLPTARRIHAWIHQKPEKAKEALGIICCAKMCNASFPTEELLEQHALIAHKADKLQAELAICNKSRPFQCNICYAHFFSEQALKSHRNRKYLPKRHQCPSCGQCFHFKKQLELHEGTHMTEKNVVCEICSKRFYTKAKLQEHLNYHAAKPRFVCDLCGKIFTKTSRLQAHMLAHEGRLPFVCEVCNKAFPSKTRLVYHSRMHTGEGFQCRHCYSKFIRKADRDSHEKKKHFKEKSP